MDAPDRSVEFLDRATRSVATSRLIIDIAAAASGELDLDQILHEALGRLRSVVPLTGGSIALVDGDDLVIRAAIGPFAEEALGQRLTRGPSRSWGVVAGLEPYLTGDLLRDGDRMRGESAAKSLRSWLAVPIIRHGVGIGLVEIDSTAVDAFGAGDLELLEGIVTVLAGHVELAAHHAEEVRARTLREAFIGVISHELRTPITSIYGLARVLRQRADSLPDATRIQAITDIEEESERLYRLVEDLLVLSRAERGRVDIDAEPINLGRLVTRIIDGEAQRRPDREFLVSVPADLALIEAEETYVEQVVRNLVSNAAKYSSPPEPIEIVVAAEEATIAVRILDRGIGVDEAAAAGAFELFYRTREASRFAAGAGIGLFVCRQLIDAMGGEVWLRPRDGGGSESGFRLPVVDRVDDGEA
ncbi:MAG: two-component system, OmpR family, sensor histidine kinase KdpD [Chloroflexota bacterium]|nr:two-component system, OmpR family, sensor histidine kinase KdpD [Chloroflexota bacterium]